MRIPVVVKATIKEIFDNRATAVLFWGFAILGVFEVGRSITVSTWIAQTNKTAAAAVVAAEKAVAAAEKAVVAADSRAAEVKLQLQVDALKVRETQLEHGRLLDELRKSVKPEEPKP